ncbi:RagB/SusD family nutrient uptake outer membrane protein [Flavobacterium lipolyticum]|uniref:RagB/SusD family nutrient uptake outer membrane protein n=1 Tax=Flavobacterium lipolyticum TaxID=2893754 RepID=A0ABS8M463_9FLAO|nr:RagB/SusD family nutrient uptake outer membrane protein [Flavobacterium sp. F-126]MCC9019552.1 RagB/SusD family nutrient uptake outer membrane protein [Flavobacterium sp. F-126]
MKKLIKIILVSVVVLGMNACTEEKILDLNPINNISEEDAFSTAALVGSYMNGVYNAAAIGQYNNTLPNDGRGFIWGAAFVQQGDTRGEDVVSTASFYQNTYTAAYDPNTANNVYYWVDGYRLINRCNLMIEGVNTAVAKGVITAAVGDDYIGQAKFLRAITHFELLNYFARPYNFTTGASHPGVLYREVGVNTQAEVISETAKLRNTVAECYAKILADLTDAERLITTKTIAKASKNAAIAFKTRVYLHKRDWANVIAEGAKLTTYSLTPRPGDPFVLGNNLINVESIFSIQHSTVNNPSINGALASMHKDRGLIAISPIIWRNPMWLSDDKRREETYDGNGEATGMVLTKGGTKITNKYTDVKNRTDAAPVIRYAEVLLSMAEAQARLTSPNLSESLRLLNLVRDRSLANPVAQTYTTASFATASDLVKAILLERRIEFLSEGRRWSDIHRLQKDDIAPIDGIPGKLANGSVNAALYTLGSPYSGPYGVAAIPGEDRRFLWPIPQVERNANPDLEQNPLW